MSIAKAVVTGTVYRAAEKRYTQNDVAVSSFVLNIGTRDELLIRVISKRKILDDLVSSLEKNDKVLVEGDFKSQRFNQVTALKDVFTKLMQILLKK